MFLPSDAFPVKGEDLLYLQIIFISIREFSRNKNYFKREGLFSKLLWILLIYQIFEFVISYITGADTLIYIIKVARINIIYLAFFYLRKIPLKSYQSFINIMLIVNIVEGIFYYLQIAGFDGILQGRVDEANYSDELVRYANGPIMASFFIIYFLLGHFSPLKKILAIIFFGITVVLGMSRGNMFSIAGTLVAFIFIKRKFNYLPGLIVFLIVGYIVAMPILQYRSNEGRESTLDDIKNIVTAPDITQIGFSGGEGTFTFRVAMLVERYEYLRDNPQYLLTGVGDIHEDSPNCYNRFHFLIGTVNADRYYGYCQIESGDITWVPILVRYGLIGMVIYLAILVSWLLAGIKYIRNTTDTIAIVFGLMSISTWLLFFQTTIFDNRYYLFWLMIYMGYLTIHNKQFAISGSSKRSTI